MAGRLATEYKQIELDLSSQELQEFIQLFKNHDLQTEVRVFENGDTEFILYDEGNKIPLSFRYVGPIFICEGSYLFKDRKLALIMQKAVRHFKGDALVHRIYHKQVIEYRYANGKVMEIKEFKNEQQRLIYKYSNQKDQIYRLLNEQVVENQISLIKLEIDGLLDQRLLAQAQDIRDIDQQLRELTTQLFILEA